MMIEVGGRIWRNAQQLLDERKDCIDNLKISDCLGGYANLYRKPIPFVRDEIDCITLIDSDYLFAALALFSDITFEMCRYY